MGTNFPSDFDTFIEPSSPEDTPLSSSGSGNYNHPESHTNMGDAIEALERNVAVKEHDHSGADNRFHGPKLDQANTHQNHDTDSALDAKHHTLGLGPFQAMPGDHIPDYNDLTSLPFKICLSSSRPGAPVQGMVIYESDTKCFRQWETFPNNVVINGLNSLIEFDTASSVTIGGGGWSIDYSSSDTTHGIMATPSGSLVWIDNGSSQNTGRALRTDPSDAVTETDDQVLTWKVGSTVIEEDVPPFTTGAANIFYLRCSSDKLSYLKLLVANGYIKLLYTNTGSAGEKLLGHLDNISTDIPNTEWRAILSNRTLSLYRVGQFMGSIIDTKSVTAKGADNRGWMVGMQSGERVFGQTSPSEIEWVRVQDQRYFASATKWSLLPIGNIPIVRLRQSKSQKLTNSGTILEFAEEVQDTFGYFNKNVSQTDIVIGETGTYDAGATLQWDTQICPDQAHAVIMVNGQETYIRDSKFLRGSGLAPGFSQTLAISGSLPLVEGDVVQVKAKYVAPGGILNQIFSFFDAPSRVNSRFELTYRGP